MQHKNKNYTKHTYISIFR